MCIVARCDIVGIYRSDRVDTMCFLVCDNKACELEIEGFLSHDFSNFWISLFKNGKFEHY